MTPDVHRLRHAFDQAELRADTDALNALLADDFRSIGEQGYVLDKAQWVGKFDGRGYRVTGDRSSDSRAYTMINQRSMDFTGRHFGTVTITGHIVISADGKTRTVTTHRVDVNGKRFRSTAVYQKQ